MMKKRTNMWLGIVSVVALAAAIAALAGAYGRLYALPPGGVPSVLDYQGRLADAAGNPVASGNYSVTFRLYDAETGGSLLWSESQTVTVQSDGVFDALLGSTATLSSAVFAGPLYLELMVEDEALSPRQRLASVPYAFVADDALKLGGNSASDYALRTDLSIPGTINDVANLVDWSRLKNVPAGFADGVDDAGGVGGDAGTLDGLDSVQFLRSDTSTTYAGGTLTIAPGTTLDVDGVLRMDGNVTRSNTNLVTNLNADLLDGLNGIQFLRSDVDSTLAAVRTIGNLDADLLDGLNSTDFIRTTDWNGNIDGNLNVSGTVTTAKVNYATPRVHRVSIPGEGFHLRHSEDTEQPSFFLGGGNGGAGFGASNSDPLVAPVNLPDGAVITGFKAFFYDTSATSDIEVTLQRLNLGSGGYDWLAQVTSSGSVGYSAVTDSSINNSTVDNANYGYLVQAFANPWDGTSHKIMGVVITYTLSEAP